MRSLIDKSDVKGPFDIIGDIHGCYDELCEMLEKLGYTVDRKGFSAFPPEGRKTVFIGDICDRGPKNMDSFRIAMNMVKGGAYYVLGNHDAAVLRRINGKEPELAHHGLDETMEQLKREKKEFVAEVESFLSGLPGYYIFDGGNLVVAHAGLKEEYQGKGDEQIRFYCIYGDTTGEITGEGRYVRLPWEEEYRGKALVVYGHFPAPEVIETGNTICIDTGCVFGGKLTCLKYPEKEIVQISAAREYYDPKKPINS